jgi:thiol peroxidase
MERKNAVTIKGSPLTLLGEEVKVGLSAPSFKVLDNELQDVSSEDLKGRIRLIASVPSLDTPVCDLEIKRFNEEAVKLSKELAIIFISMDLPFAQKRFCQVNEIKQVVTFSDHRNADFGFKYGVLIKELRLLSRAIFVIDKGNIIRYTEYVPELSSHPDYTAALNALRDIAK